MIRIAATLTALVLATGCKATVPNGTTRTPAQWQRHLAHVVETREAELGACFASADAKGRTRVKLAIRGPLRIGHGAPGAYSGWGHTDAMLYVGQLPPDVGAPQPPDDTFNRCLADALKDLQFPYDENNAVDATWVITYDATKPVSAGSR